MLHYGGNLILWQSFLSHEVHLFVTSCFNMLEWWIKDKKLHQNFTAIDLNCLTGNGSHCFSYQHVRKLTVKTPRPPLPRRYYSACSLSVFIVGSMFALLVNICSTCGSAIKLRLWGCYWSGWWNVKGLFRSSCADVRAHVEVCALDVVRCRSLRLCHGSPIVFPTHKPLWEMRIAWVDGSFHMTLWSQVSLALLFSCSLLHKHCFYWCLLSFSRIIHFCIYIHVDSFSRCFHSRRLWTRNTATYIGYSYYWELIRKVQKCVLFQTDYVFLIYNTLLSFLKVLFMSSLWAGNQHVRKIEKPKL